MQEYPANSPLQQAGIKQTQFNSGDLRIEALDGVTLVRVHSLEEPDGLGALFDAARMALPKESNQAAGLDPAVLCLRPGEWLLCSEELSTRRLAGRLQSGLDPRYSALIDCSDGLAVFRLSGDPAPWLLAKLGSLDFLDRAAPRQQCPRTLLGRCPVIIHRHPADSEDGAIVHDLMVERSTARHLWELLCASAPHAEELARIFGGKPLAGRDAAD